MWTYLHIYIDKIVMKKSRWAGFVTAAVYKHYIRKTIPNKI